VSHNHSMSASGTAASNGTHRHSMYVAGDDGEGDGGGAGHGVARDYDNPSIPESGAYHRTTIMSNSGAHSHTVSVSGTIASQGVSATNANLQPYITVYIWRRTA
jgi:hypothetical protein